MRYFIHMAYNGLNYRGWQRQTNGTGGTNAQTVIEAALSRVLKIPINIVGCGRTDTQVHASQFFFHFDVELDFDPEILLFRINKTLPDDIVFYDIIPMEGQPHARFDAFHRRYDYFLHTEKDPYLNGLSSLYEEKGLDYATMKAAVSLLPKYDDYRGFCRSPEKYEHTICRVTDSALWINESGTKLRFQISANRYLGKMIRIIMARLLEIGRGELSIEEFERYLSQEQIPDSIIPARPHGLYLSKVTYPYLDLPVKQSLSASLLNDWIEVV